jgi:hypothetical protein
VAYSFLWLSEGHVVNQGTSQCSRHGVRLTQ